MEGELDHLSTDEIQDLMRRYYEGEAASKLIKEYNIPIKPSALYKAFPPQAFEDYTCEYCGEPLVLDRLSKTMKNIPRYERELYCPICGHKPYQSYCRCENCVDREKERQSQQLEQIQAAYSRERTPADFTAFSFRDKVFLGALCRALLRENLHEIDPYAGSEVVLAPTNDLCHDLYSSLIHKQAIAVSPTSPLEAFDVGSEDFPNTFYTYKVTYYLNLLFPPNKKDLFTEILNPNYYSADYAEEAFVLWKEIAVAECIEYLLYQLDKVGFEFSPGDKTYKTFEIILNDFSVSQTYGVIWKAVADASKLYLEKGISKKHAANTVIGACERYAERAKLNGWDLTQYNRIKDVPQSVLSTFFFNRVLAIGEQGFRVPPSLEQLKGTE